MYENIVSVGLSERTVPVGSVPSFEVEFIHALEVSSDLVVCHGGLPFVRAGSSNCYRWCWLVRYSRSISVSWSTVPRWPELRPAPNATILKLAPHDRLRAGPRPAPPPLGDQQRGQGGLFRGACRRASRLARRRSPALRAREFEPCRCDTPGPCGVRGPKKVGRGAVLRREAGSDASNARHWNRSADAQRRSYLDARPPRTSRPSCGDTSHARRPRNRSCAHVDQSTATIPPAGRGPGRPWSREERRRRVGARLRPGLAAMEPGWGDREEIPRIRRSPRMTITSPNGAAARGRSRPRPVFFAIRGLHVLHRVRLVPHHR
jgi:hypothetical protein